MSRISDIIEMVRFNHPLGGWRYYPKRDYGKGEYDLYDAKKQRPLKLPELLNINPKEKLDDGQA